jgi:hypothetical protein
MKNPEDKWSAQKEDLAQLAGDQVTADIEVVESARALKAATERHTKAVARQTTVGKKLTQARGALGAE